MNELWDGEDVTQFVYKALKDKVSWSEDELSRMALYADGRLVGNPEEGGATRMYPGIILTVGRNEWYKDKIE